MPNKFKTLAVVGLLGTTFVGMSQISFASSTSKTVLTLWTQNNGAEVSTVVKNFEKKYPNIVVKISTFATDPLKQAEKVAANSHTLPDIWFDWGGTLASYYEQNGLALNLNPYIKKFGWNKRFSPLSLKLSSFKGNLYEVPLQLNGLGLFYRKDIFSKYHLSPPTTFAQLNTDAAILRSHGVAPFGLGGLHSWMTMRFMDALIEHYAGAQMHDKLMGLSANWNNPKVIAAFQELRNWTVKKYLYPGFLAIDETQDTNQFEQGKAAMILEGPWVMQTFASDKFPINKVGFIPFPEGGTNRLSSFMQGYMINAHSPNVSDALKFMNFYTSTAELNRVRNLVQMPVANVHVFPPANQPQVKQVQQDSVKNGGFLISDQFFPQTIVQDYWQAIDSVAGGTMTPQKAAVFMQKQISAYKSSSGY